MRDTNERERLADLVRWCRIDAEWVRSKMKQDGYADRIMPRENGVAERLDAAANALEALLRQPERQREPDGWGVECMGEYTLWPTRDKAHYEATPGDIIFPVYFGTPPSGEPDDAIAALERRTYPDGPEGIEVWGDEGECGDPWHKGIGRDLSRAPICPTCHKALPVYFGSPPGEEEEA